MPSSGRRNGPSNLLMESPSDSDVPDLELIAPVKVRKKKLFSKKFSPRISIKDGDGHSPVICTANCALICLLFSLVLGLVVLTFFTLSLSNELNTLKQSIGRGSLSSQSSSVTDNLQKTVDELRNELKGCCSSCCESAKTTSGTTTTQITPNPTPPTSNVGLDSNASSELTNAVAQLTNATYSMAFSMNGIKKSITNITSRLDILEEKCSSTVCAPPSQTSPADQTQPKGLGPPGDARNITPPTLMAPTGKHRRSGSDSTTGDQVFQFVRKP